VVAQGLPFESESALWTVAFRYLAFINVALTVFNLAVRGSRSMADGYSARCCGSDGVTCSGRPPRQNDWGQGFAWALIGLGVLRIFGGVLVGGLWLIFTCRRISLSLSWPY
jgi:hypothetical protein